MPRLTTLLIALLAGCGPAVAAPRVVASIAPLHSIAATVMEGAGEPELLVPATASPHGFALRPSQARLLAEADLVVRIGGGLDDFLDRSLTSLAPQARVLSWSEAAVAGGSESADEIHPWLDPSQAAGFAIRLAEMLAEEDPAQAGRYSDNAARLAARLQALDTRLATRLAPFAATPFVVMHDAYRALQDRYDLKGGVGALEEPAMTVSVAGLARLRQLAARHPGLCVFGEPQMAAGRIEALFQDRPVRAAELDALGADLDPGPTLYETMMDRLGASLADCLGRTPS